MEFISCEGLDLVILIRATEGDVDHVRQSQFGSPQRQESDAPLNMEDRASCPTPGEVIGQIGRVIAVCLGLGLLARVLVAFTGMQ
jgi:hypothetical protein